MSTVHLIFLYTFSCSSLLLYGIGLEKTFFESRPRGLLYKRLPILTLELFVSVLAAQLLVKEVLIPHSFLFLIPVSILCIAGFFQTVSKVLRKDTSYSPPGERLMFLGSIFLAVFESTGYADTLLISSASLFSFGLWTVLLSSIRERIDTSRLQADWNGTPIVLVCLGLLSIILHATDVSWWIQEFVR
ncbi:MAG TPA: hypothetical protein PK969_12170 [Treponemataceae bacterium]|jgi:Na+-translocating ferredoxin:NAD+ oxidoreductase RnfA subunit|nr:hypothetical protein [Treponemataceae bacterium]